MPTDSVSIETVCDGIRDVLTGLSGIGHISIRPGGVPTWRKTALARQAYWEIDVPSVVREPAGLGNSVFELITVRIEGYMPWSYENLDTATTWRALLKRVEDRLTNYPTLANQIDGVTSTKREGLPQLLENSRVEFADGAAHPLVHYCRIECTYRRYYTFSSSVAL